VFEFKDYTVDEMLQIFRLMSSGLNVDPRSEEVIRPILASAEGVREAGNGRFVRNLLEGAMRNQAVRLQRLADPTPDDLITLLPEDFKYAFVMKISGSSPEAKRVFKIVS
jgi:hypothetical protein